VNYTPSQTIGPFFRFGLDWLDASALAPDASPGAVEVHGVVYDGEGLPVPDAMLELWQPPRFGRVLTEPDGSYHFTTMAETGYIDVSLFARGLLQRVVTRMYFPGQAVAEDPVLAGVPEHRRATLVATEEADGCLRFDVHLQGPRETVFFDF
jgi:protocatechuate 3,4-dioxygenase, alpha subunit